MSRAVRGSLLVALTAFFLNPSFGCDGGEDFQYGAEEMRVAIEGTWNLTLSHSDGQEQVVTVAIAQGGGSPTAQATPGARRDLIRPAAACGTRTLIKSAGACTSSTEMPLAVSFVSGDEAFRTAEMRGTLVVHGLVFKQGQLGLVVGGHQISGTLSATGEATGLVIAFDGTRGGTATLTRVVR
jgi:hypothetical protein